MGGDNQVLILQYSNNQVLKRLHFHAQFCGSVDVTHWRLAAAKMTEYCAALFSKNLHMGLFLEKTQRR